MQLDFSQMLVRLESMVNTVIALVPNIVMAAIAFFLLYLVAKGVRTLVIRLSARYGRHQSLGLVLGRLVRWLITLAGFLLSAVIVFPDFSPAQLIELLGIGTVAIGFAFRDVLQNFLAGIIVLLAQPFQVGDQIVVNNFEGTVEDIQSRATVIRTYDSRQVVVPNAVLFTSPVMVNTAYPTRRIQYDVGIGYGDDIDRAKQLILETVRGIGGVLDDPEPEVLVVALADSSVNLRVRWWIEPPRRADAMDTQDQILALIKQNLLENGIDLPFPTQQILFHDQTEETDGDRVRQREGWPAGNSRVPRSRSIAGVLSRAMQTGANLRDSG